MSAGIEKLERIVSALIPPHGTHGLEHTMRVYRTCMALGKALGADMSILLPAVLLHDVVRDGEDHASASSVKAGEILRDLDYPEKAIKEISKTIGAHSFSAGRIPESLEAKILSDADKLDAMGALGVYRAAMYSAEHGRPLEDYIAHFSKKLLTLRDMIFTDEARRLAESRHRFLLEFLEQIEGELNFG
ncbi:HD domain-containing protein [Candidatus Bathyarchaeota archaeon]|nr:HD domain-containing protein [Candidatus Bathyarchaeota archaeon]